jgi:uncharacterized membrane protein YjfL (UPF0719 family)
MKTFKNALLASTASVLMGLATWGIFAFIFWDVTPFLSWSSARFLLAMFCLPIIGAGCYEAYRKINKMLEGVRL